MHGTQRNRQVLVAAATLYYSAACFWPGLVAGASPKKPATRAEKLAFSDDFETGDFRDRWRTGATHGKHTIKNVDGRIQATSNFNFIETKASFKGDLRVEVDVAKEGERDHGCWDFYIELTSLASKSGIVRFDYKGIDAVGIGMSEKDCASEAIRTSAAVRRGKATLTYSAPYMSFTFTGADGKVSQVGSTYAGHVQETSVRIWLAAYPVAPRYVDNVKIYQLTEPPAMSGK